MTPERYQRISELYHRALEQQAEQRAAFVGEACDGDAELRQEVESLLAAAEDATGFMTSDVAVPPEPQTSRRRTAPQLIGRMLGSYEIRIHFI